MLGLIGKKVGMTQVFDESGILTSVTVIKIEENEVIAERNMEKNGYTACVMGAVDKKKNRVSKPYGGQFKKGTTPKRFLIEMKDFEEKFVVGDKFGVELLDGCLYVDVEGTTKGKGFQGAMKRHNFGGGPITHGSKFKRGLGGTGMAATPSKVHKGTKMAGRMGGVKQTVQNLRIIKIDVDKRVIMVGGAVPGPASSMVIVKMAKKK